MKNNKKLLPIMRNISWLLLGSAITLWYVERTFISTREFYVWSTRTTIVTMLMIISIAISGYLAAKNKK